MPEQQPQPLTTEELLAGAEKFLGWARNNYRNQYATPDQVNNAALISLAGSAVVIARLLAERLPEQPLPDTPAGEI